MKKIIQFLVIIILLAIIAGGYIFWQNPNNLRDKFISSMINNYLESIETETTNINTGNTEETTHELLNQEQVNALEDIGVDVDALPNTITPAMEACFVTKLGQNRVDEIIAGEAPSAIDLFKAKSCLES